MISLGSLGLVVVTLKMPRSLALSLLKSGFWVVVIPGGAEEGMIGHENAYKVCWPKKRELFIRE